MNIQRTLIHAFLRIPYAFRKVTGRGPFGRHKPTYHHGPVDAGGNLLKASLLKHHVKQFSESACSVASVVTAINAARTVQGSRFTPVTQPDILENVTTAHWKERMGDDGHDGRRGLPLALLERIVKDSLEIYQIDCRAVEIVQAHKQADRAGAIKETLRQHLEWFEKKGDRLLIAHFDQGVFVPTLNIPHISPVGGFDMDTGKVLMLDVDPEQERLYSVSFGTFYKGLASDYHHVFRPFGYGSGGCVVVTLA